MNQRTIGILVTNTDRSIFARSQQNDGQKFTTLMQAIRPEWSYKVYDCTAGFFPSAPDECDGFVIGGSPSSVNDSEPWIKTLLDFIRALNRAKTPTVGCCFGHQAISKALGGTVGKNPGGWGFGVADTHFKKQYDWMSPAAKSLGLYAAHGEQVISIPDEATVIGGDDFCPAASLLIGDHIFTTEYHPEMSKDFFVGLTHAFEEYIGPNVAERARAQALRPTDGHHFAEWMVRFLEK